MNLSSYQKKTLARLNAKELCVYNKQWMAWEFSANCEFLKLSQLGELFIYELVKRSTQGEVTLELTDKGKALFN
jgi:hypothetical protein